MELFVCIFHSFPTSKERKLIFFIKYRHVPNWFIWLTKHLQIFVVQYFIYSEISLTPYIYGSRSTRVNFISFPTEKLSKPLSLIHLILDMSIFEMFIFHKHFFNSFEVGNCVSNPSLDWKIKMFFFINFNIFRHLKLIASAIPLPAVSCVSKSSLKWMKNGSKQFSSTRVNLTFVKRLFLLLWANVRCSWVSEFTYQNFQHLLLIVIPRSKKHIYI